MTLPLGLGAAVAVVILALVIRREAWRRFDVRLLDAIQRRVPRQGSKAEKKAATAMRDLTAFGGDLFSIVLLISGTVLLLGQGRAPSLFQLFSLMLSARLAGLVLKKVIRRQRPPSSPNAMDVFTSSFPSIHTTMSFVSTFSIATILIDPNSPSMFAAIAFSGSVAALVGMTRLYFAVHWPLDVLAGWLLGLSACLVGANILQL